MMRIDRAAISMLRAYLFGKGPATAVPGGLHAFLKSRPGLAVPDLEFMFRHTPEGARPWGPLAGPAYADGFAVRVVLLHPDSRGSVRLASPDPLATPLIRLGLLEAASDLRLLTEGIALARRVAGQAALDGVRGVELSPGHHVADDEAIAAFIRRTVVTALHPASTCAIGPHPRSVLDPQLRVRGIQRLRVIDASAMPDVPSAHLNAAVMMMAEKAADLIRGSSATADVGTKIRGDALL